MFTSRLSKTSKRAALAAASLATVAGPAAASAQAQVTYQCTPPTAGQAVTSGGVDGTCPAGHTLMRLPKDPLAQQKLLDLLPYLSIKADGVGGKPTITFTGANIQIVNGAGKTMSKNGTGNLVLGYNEQAGSQTGSHSFWTGYAQTVTGAATFVSGFDNKATGDLSTVAGGAHGTASGFASLIGGGWYQSAGEFGTALGGRNNNAKGYFDVAIGGENNVAKGGSSTTLGGYSNVGGGRYSVAAGGCSNLAGAGTLATYDSCPTDNASYSAVGDAATVFGGKFNHAAATMTTIAGGERNKASGRLSGIAVGKERVIGSASASAVANHHWVRMDAAGRMVASSGPVGGKEVTTYAYGGGWKLAWFPGMDMAKCSVSVEPDTGGDAKIGYRHVQGEYVYVQIHRGSTPVDDTGLMVSMDCPV